jgi:hypothetical protein
MIVALIASLLVQEIPVPKDWTRQGPSVYSPAGVRPQDCFLNILPSIDYTGTAGQWHDAVWTEVTRGSKLDVERTRGDAGSFAMSSSVMEKDGEKRWMSCFTGLADGRGYTVVYSASSEALYRAHLGAARDMISRGRAAPAPVLGGLRYILPSGWSARDVPGGVQYLPPTLAAGADVSLSIAQPQPSQVPADSAINQVTYNFFLNKTNPGYQEGVTTSMGGFRVAIVKSKTHRIAIYGARWEQSVQLVFFSANSEDLYRQYAGEVEAMIRKTVVPGFKPDPNAWHPSPIPPPERDVKIAASYFGCGLDTRNSVDPHDWGIWNRNYREALVLFENGIAVRADIVNSGRLDTTYVSEGFATLDVAGMKELPNRRFGRWKEESGTVTVQMFQGAPLKLARDGDDLKGDWTWNRMKPLDGLRPAGTYRRVVASGQVQSITLKEDGTFETTRANEVMGGSLVNPDFPVFGRGSYEIRKWSLILRFDTGFVQSMNLMTDGTATPKKLVVNGSVFDKTP